jgi:hypothetical protein
LDQLQLSDFDIDHQLLGLPGASLVIFTSVGCASCRWAKEWLPRLRLSVERLCWVDAEENGGAVQRYDVFHLPALFVVRDGKFYGALQTSLEQQALDRALRMALQGVPDDLP